MDAGDILKVHLVVLNIPQEGEISLNGTHFLEQIL